MSEQVDVGTDVSELVGRTIISAHRAPPSKEEWTLCDQTLTLTLDDGSVWSFIGEGYDASGLVVYVEKPVGATE